VKYLKKETGARNVSKCYRNLFRHFKVKYFTVHTCCDAGSDQRCWVTQPHTRPRSRELNATSNKDRG